MSGAFKQGQFQVLPLNKSDKTHRGMLWADVNGDGLPDLLVAEPESGQISIYLQKPDGTLDAPQDISDADRRERPGGGRLEGNGKPSIFLLSTDERQIGVTQLDEKGRLPFPTLIPLDGKPLAMAVGRLQPEGEADAGGDHGPGRQAVAGDADGGRQGPDAEAEREFQIQPDRRWRFTT